MKWWSKSPKTSSSPSSPSSSQDPSASASASPSRGAPPASPSRARKDVISLFSRNNKHEPRLTRQRKIRHLAGIQVGQFSFDEGSSGNGGAGSGSSHHHRRERSAYSSNSTPVSRSPSSLDDVLVPLSARSSSSLVLLPRPLPVPESASTSQRIPELQVSVGCPLPSPRAVAGFRVGDKEGKDGTGDLFSHGEHGGEKYKAAGRRLPFLQSIGKSFEHGDSPVSSSGHSKYIKEDPNGSKQSFRLGVPAKSAPSSGLSSPLHSPRGLSSRDYVLPPYFSPQVHFVSTSTDFPSDFLAGFPSQAPFETFVGSPDGPCATPYSPTVRSPGLRSRNPSAPSSPLHPKLFPENSSPWTDSKGNVSGHPLPLPPGVLPPQSPPHPITPKVEVSSMATQWQKGVIIGRGTFGSVYKATNRNNGATCAMKEVDLIPDDPKSRECIKQLQQEIKFLSQLKHRNIVEYYGSEIVEDKFYIYLEFVAPGSIQKYLNECEVTESVVRSFTGHILEGLAYLHSQDVMHRDIKGANLLVDTHGVVKLADFGMAKHLGEVKGQLSMKGTPYWMAPEVLQASMNKELGYNLAVDIWSLGCTVIEMFTRKHPWNGLESAAAMFKVLHASPDIPETLSDEGKDFLRLCFQRNPADRPSASELLKHPFVAPFNNELRSSFAGMKLDDCSHWSKNNLSARIDSSVKAKHMSNGETAQLHYPEATDYAGNHTSPRSTLETVPSYSPPHLSREAVSFPSPRFPNGSPRTSLDLHAGIPSSPPRSSHDAHYLRGPSNFMNGFHGAVANPMPFAFSKPRGRDVPHLF